MNSEEYRRKTRGLRAAQARVVGVLRGGFFDPSQRMFYYTAKGHHCAPVEAVKEFAYVVKRKRLKRDKRK